MDNKIMGNWYELKVTQVELPLDLSPMGRSRTVSSYYTFDTIEKVFAQIDQIAEKHSNHGGYITFSQTGECIPVDENEIVLTVYHHEILCPISAGGRWQAWDEYNNEL